MSGQEPNQRRPSGGSNSSGSKTGSSRKKGQPKKLIHRNSNSPLDHQQQSSPDSVYAPSNYSPKEEDQRPTPSSSRSSNGHAEGPMDFSKSNRDDDGEERPLVINESEPEIKHRSRTPSMTPVSQSGLPNPAQFLQSIRGQMPYGNLPFPFPPPGLGADHARTSSESSGPVDHDSERDDR